MSKLSKRKPRLPNLFELTFLGLVILAVVVAGLIILLFARVQRGLLGIVLSALAILLLFYWLREFRKISKFGGNQLKAGKDDWLYEIMEDEEIITVIAQVPGPSEEVKARQLGNSLYIEAGRGFRKVLQIPKKSVLYDYAYSNGVLNVKLRKQEDS